MLKISKKNAIRAYKVFNPDFTCRGFQYEVGKTYEHNGEVKVCDLGFHSCKKLMSCFIYYDFNPKNKVAEVLIWGDIDTDENKDKYSSSNITIIRELSWEEVLNIVNCGPNNTGFANSGDNNSGYYNSGNCNSGNYNSGNNNSGDYNSGYYNSGELNSGYCNSGNCNSGDHNSGCCNVGSWNSTNNETGFFNTTRPKTIRVFNKECPIKVWENSEKPEFIYFALNKWDDELKKLVVVPYKQAFQNSYNRLSEEDKKQQTEMLKKLPNFDKDVFYEISGIKID